MLETIEELLRADPFQPFVIVLTNGDRYEVDNPNLLAVGRSLVYYAYPRSDRLAHLRINQIAAAETLEPTQ